VSICEVRKAHAIWQKKDRQTSVSKPRAIGLCRASGQPPGATNTPKEETSAFSATKKRLMCCRDMVTLAIPVDSLCQYLQKDERVESSHSTARWAGKIKRHLPCFWICCVERRVVNIRELFVMKEAAEKQDHVASRFLPDGP
jgi:hypothetical protein